MNTSQEYIELFKAKEDLLEKASPSFMMNIREEAIHEFGLTGLLERKDELYKYTSLQKLFEPSYTMQLQPSNVDFSVEDIFNCDVPNLHTRLEIILNGFYKINGTALTEMDNGIIIGSFAEALRKYPELVREHYAKHAGIKNDSLVALNTAFAIDGKHFGFIDFNR